MWDHYKKTFRGIQIVIWLVTLSVYVFFGRQWQQAATFFLFIKVFKTYRQCSLGDVDAVLHPKKIVGVDLVAL